MEKKEYKLSKNAFQYLDNIKFENNKNHISIKSIKIKTNLVLKIEKVKKIKQFIFSATLANNDYKSDKFILIFRGEEEIPKKGDIIKIKEIEKCYDEKNNKFIYECNEISIIDKEINFNFDISKRKSNDKKINLINDEKLNNIKKIKFINKKIEEKNEKRRKEEEDEEEEEEDEEENEETDNNERIKKKYISKNKINP